MTESLQILVYIAACGAALAAVTKWVVLPVARGLRRFTQFLEDWLGEPARPGFEGRAGVMERLGRVEHQTARAEFHLGNGDPTPLRAIVVATAERQAELKKSFDEHVTDK